MLVFFLRFMRQKNGRQICVQLLQTLNILFENISNETSVCKCFRLYFCLYNNFMMAWCCLNLGTWNYITQREFLSANEAYAHVV